MVLLSLSLAGCSGKSTEAPAETAAAEENKEEKQAEPAPTDVSEKKQEETQAENAVAEPEEKQENSGGAANGNIDVDALIKDAEAGDAEAQFELGYLYYYGVKVEKDYAKAAEWFTKSAEQGNAYGQCMLGICYLLGTGVEQNDE